MDWMDILMMIVLIPAGFYLNYLVRDKFRKR